VSGGGWPTGPAPWNANPLPLCGCALGGQGQDLIGASGGDKGVRDFIAAVNAATGKLAWRKCVIPAPGEPGSESWKDDDNARQTGGAMWIEWKCIVD
jgi:alcohol dehydrogenase (cytochrome c)